MIDRSRDPVHMTERRRKGSKKEREKEREREREREREKTKEEVCVHVRHMRVNNSMCD